MPSLKLDVFLAYQALAVQLNKVTKSLGHDEEYLHNAKR